MDYNVLSHFAFLILASNGFRKLRNIGLVWNMAAFSKELSIKHQRFYIIERKKNQNLNKNVKQSI